MRTIHDEFTHLPVSRQRKGQLRRQRDGLCIICSQPQATPNYCLKHAIANRERSRRKIGATRRYNTLTYRLAAAGTL